MPFLYLSDQLDTLPLSFSLCRVVTTYPDQRKFPILTIYCFRCCSLCVHTSILFVSLATCIFPFSSLLFLVWWSTWRPTRCWSTWPGLTLVPVESYWKLELTSRTLTSQSKLLLIIFRSLSCDILAYYII